jgi:glucokinase-like ROK family protein
MKVKTGNHGYLRQQNLSGVLQRIFENAPISRIELARSTGLNKATISSLVGDLLENRFVREIGEGSERRAGRREVLLDLDPARGCMVSAEIGVGFISVVCTDFKARIVWRERELTEDLEPTAVLEKTVSLLSKARAAGEERTGDLQGIAVGIPGLIDRESGKLLLAPNLGWRDVEILGLFRSKFDVPVFIDNEATFAALGERYFGVARGKTDVLYISAGVGIGGGLIIGGQIFNGTGGFASEFGHMTMDPDGLKCGCGNTGCWETQASQAALFRNIRAEISGGKKSSISKKDIQELSVAAVVEAAQKGDAAALAALRTTAGHLAIGIDSLVKAFDPEVVVFGGILSLAGEFILPVIERELAKRSIPAGRATTPVVPAQFGSDAAAMGGIAKIFQSILAEPAP